MSNPTKNNYELRGVQFTHAGAGRWHFTARKPDGSVITKIEKIRGGKTVAEKIAASIAASVKRGFAGTELIDSMARGQIRKINPVVMATYKGINFSFAR